jgi:hypothetical protein
MTSWCGKKIGGILSYNNIDSIVMADMMFYKFICDYFAFVVAFKGCILII